MPSFTVFKGSKDGSIKKSQTTRPDPKNDEVLLRITASGLCGTDQHYRNVDMALGHEGVGIIEAVGPAVKKLRVGDRVGWGYIHDSCGDCESCNSGRENTCEEREMYGISNFDQGSMGSHAIWREHWVFKIPEGVSDKEAAPLMCGGATVFNALRMYDIQPTQRVGVMGVGGLGHLAIQFASKMGCNVIVFSGSESKKEEAMKLGATEFVAMKGKTELKLQKKVDVLLVTTSTQPNWELMLPAMAPNSKIFPLTVSNGNLTIPYTPIIMGGISIQGSVVAPRGIQKQMIEFAAQHKIKPILMEFPLTEEGITKAMKTLDDGNMRYRGVLVPQN